MDAAALEKIGLTRGEARVYLAMLNLGATKTGPLASKAGVSSSKVYKILGRLEKKGLAGHILKGGVKLFQAMPPRRIVEYLEQRQDELGKEIAAAEGMLPELELQHRTGGRMEAAVFLGFKAVTNLFKVMLDEIPRGGEYFVIGGNYGQGVPGLREFFYAYHRIRARKKVKANILANFGAKPFVKTSFLNSEIRYLPEYMVSNMQIAVYGNKAFIAVWSHEPVGFVLENEEAVKGFKSYFDALWKIAKK